MVLSSAYDILCFEDAEGFLASLEEKVPDLVLMDVGLPAMSGIEALGIFKRHHPQVPVIMITAYGEISMVIDSMKSGAYDFIFKPINPDILELNIEKALASIALVKEVQVLQEKYLRENEPCFIGASKKKLMISWILSIWWPKARIRPS